MTSAPGGTIPPGWTGGFRESDPAFEYPEPVLDSLPLYENMDHIHELRRQQAVLWPEFSWRTDLDDESSRCFQMFAPDISRIGYDDTGRVYSIICPQQGLAEPSFGSFNVEVSVTGQRGWVDESASSPAMAADMTVEGKIWFTPSAVRSGAAALLWWAFEATGLPFPASKKDAIRVTTHRVGDPSNPVFPVRSGPSPRFDRPGFTLHPEAWDVANIEVEIGPIASTGDDLVDGFNALVMDAFNAASGNLLAPTNVLTWNVYFTGPALVDQTEWREHAEKWRESIDADHGSPDGPGTSPRYADGSPYHAGEQLPEELYDAIRDWVKSHLSIG